MIEEVKRAIIEIIANDGVRWNWYKLDRALVEKGLAGQQNLAKLASELAREGLISETSGEDSGMHTYSITDAGRKFLNEPRV